MKIYTKTGDNGKTTLIGGKRVAKSDLYVEAYGSLDELNSLVGLLNSLSAEPLLEEIQRDLFGMGAHLASCCSRSVSVDPHKLEEAIDKMQERLPAIGGFVLPGGSTRGSLAHVCRATCRRVERRMVALQDENISAEALAYINRLSDYFFVLARYLNFIDKKEENLL